MMNSYKPGQSIYFSTTLTVLGVDTDPATLSLLLHPPSGANIAVVLTRDSLGVYHGTTTIPITAAPGIWVERWQSTAPDGLVERLFVIEALDF